MSNEELACAVQQGDSDALAQLWEQVKDYAYTIVMRYATKPYADTEDYLQTAFLGIRAAAQAFDPLRGSFLTVAALYIRRACARFYGWDRKGDLQTISYDVPMNPDDPGDGDFRDSFPDESLSDPWEGMEHSDMVRDVRAAVDGLIPRQRDVIDRHYYQGQSLEAISEAQSVSKARISQIEKRALEILRKDKHIIPYEREFAPVHGVGVGAFRRFGASVVERVAIKNADRERRAFERQLMNGVKNGWYTEEVAAFMLKNHLKQFDGI